MKLSLFKLILIWKNFIIIFFIVEFNTFIIYCSIVWTIFSFVLFPVLNSLIFNLFDSKFLKKEIKLIINWKILLSDFVQISEIKFWLSKAILIVFQRDKVLGWDVNPFENLILNTDEGKYKIL